MADGTHTKVLERYRSAVAALGDEAVPATRRSSDLEQATTALGDLAVAASAETNAQIFATLLEGAPDLVVRRFQAGTDRPAVLLYLDGLVTADDLAQTVVKPLTGCRIPADPGPGGLDGWISQTVLSAWHVTPGKTVRELLRALLEDAAVLMVDGAVRGLAVHAPKAEGRSIEEPKAEPVIRGPRDGFTETIGTNISLLRHRLRTPHLRIESLRIGRSSHTTVIIVHLQDVAAPAVVREVRSRLAAVEIDSLEDTGYLEELIEDNPYSLFPTIQNTERPDTVAAALSEGRVAVLADNSPFALIMPVSFWSFLQASEDYYERYPIATFLRALRFFFVFVALLGPALWIAVTSYHQEMLPTALLLTVAATREGIPFPAVVEALLMEIFFEALREAGVRLPRAVGQAVSIVGALVIGQAAVQAGIVSAPKVIVVAATGIASFTVPRFNMGITLRLLRFIMMLLAGTLGLFGLMLGMMALLYHLAALRSFGVPYLQPVAPFTLGDLTDVLVRAPRWLHDKRPDSLRVLRRRRQAGGLRPGPPGGSSGGRGP
ncbi:MAG TPA: spore germination protein [Symbiobacteriaceae bacterium]|jgi:hypothetical protein